MIKKTMHAPRISYRYLWLLVVLALCGLAPGVAVAQTLGQPPSNKPEEEPGRATQGASEASGAAAASEALIGPAGPPVSYADVLAHPDDIDLNYRYAVQQAQSGDVRGSATTLERILLIDPNLPQVRLLYAIVLFRLDSLAESQREFQAVRQMPVTDDVRAEIDRYLAQIELRQKVNRFTASLSLGGDFNTNRDFQPNSQFRYFFGAPIPVTRGQNDFGRLAIGNFEIHRDLQTQTDDELLLRSTLYYDNQVFVTSQNLKAGSFEAGFVLRRDYATFTPTLTYTKIDLADHSFMDAPGAKLLTDRKIDNNTDVYLLLQVDRQKFFDNPVSPTIISQTGWRYNTVVGVNYTLTPTMQIGATLRHTIDRAIDTTDEDAFNTDELGVSHTWLLGKGQFLLSTATYGIDSYDAPDPTVVLDNRRDNTLRLRATYGTPLDTIVTAFGDSPLHAGFGDILWTFTVEGTWAQSTITNFAYTNYKAEMLFTKRWEF
jgi:hypothetical protein